MPIKIYVSDLPPNTSSEDLRELFSQAGNVESASVVEDRDTGRSRGFGFVEMSTPEEGEAAIQQFNGREFGGRNLNVNEARPREDRGGFGRGGDRDRFSRGGSGYGGFGRGGYSSGRGHEGYWREHSSILAPPSVETETDRESKLAGEIDAALNYIASIRAVTAADWSEIEELRAETWGLLAETRRLLLELEAA